MKLFKKLFKYVVLITYRILFSHSLSRTTVCKINRIFRISNCVSFIVTISVLLSTVFCFLHYLYIKVLIEYFNIVVNQWKFSKSTLAVKTIYKLNCVVRELHARKWYLVKIYDVNFLSFSRLYCTYTLVY